MSSLQELLAKRQAVTSPLVGEIVSGQQNSQPSAQEQHPEVEEIHIIPKEPNLDLAADKNCLGVFEVIRLNWIAMSNGVKVYPVDGFFYAMNVAQLEMLGHYESKGLVKQFKTEQEE